MKQPTKILIGFVAGAALGVVCHLLAPDAAGLNFVIKNLAAPIGQIFLRLIFMIVVPLVVSALMLGVYELGDLRRLGRVGLYTLIYTVAASAVSVAIGLALVTGFQPGRGLDSAVIARLEIKSADTALVLAQSREARDLPEILVALIPKNPLAAAVNALDGEMVALMVFALIFGAALALVRPQAPDDPLVKTLESLRDVSMKVVDLAMRLAPLGVAALIFVMTARFGFSLLASLGKYVLVVTLGLALQQLVVYSLVLKLLTRVSPRRFLAATREVMLTAFTTSSSNATLPTAIRAAQENLKLDRGISSFVLTIGATANQNGTALFEGVTILFLAQVFGIELAFGQQVTVMIMSVVAGIGTAGVPGGSIPMVVIVMQSVGVPAEGIGIILGVDRFLDMCRTVLNVTGDLVAACVIDALAKKTPLPEPDAAPGASGGLTPGG